MSELLPQNLFDLVYIPKYQEQINRLEEMILPEAWRFTNDDLEQGNSRNPILSRLFRLLYYRLAHAYNAADISGQLDVLKRILFWDRNHICFHTGLYTPQYKGVYVLFKRSVSGSASQDWLYKGFFDEGAYELTHITPLPEYFAHPFSQNMILFNPHQPIRVNSRHILEGEKNIERIPEKARGFGNINLLLETAVELARKQTIICPSLVVPQVFHSGIQYLLPLSFEDENTIDLVMALTPNEGYYSGHTCITKEMAYVNSRLIGRPTVSWLTAIVKIG